MDINITESPDFALLTAIHAACFDMPWKESGLKDMLSISGTAAFIREDKTGFAILRIMGEEAEIMTMAVLPENRKRGIGAELVSGMLAYAQDKEARSIFLEVRKNNESAKALYGKFGFSEISRRRDYYHNADGSYEDAIVMKKSLRP